MNVRKQITDRLLRALKPARPGQRYEIMDTLVPNFGIRLTERGHKSFVLITRYPGDKYPARRAIGEYGKVSLEQARTIARAWHELIRRGVDPKVDAERQKLAVHREEISTFALVADRFLGRIAHQRCAGTVERIVRRVLIPAWGGRAISSITRYDVVKIVRSFADRGVRYRAHAVHSVIRALFNWAIEAGDYGLESSPCDRIRPRVLIGAKESRQRVLSDTELRGFWSATERLGYPYGAIFRLLVLTGCRKSEIAGAIWPEINREKRVLTIPAVRFKSNAQHLVPLSTSAMALVEKLPHFDRGEFVFSTTFGATTAQDHAGAKAKLDKLLKEELGFSPARFVIHDLRRTVRTGLAALRVPDHIAEMVLGHGRKGLQRVYDQHIATRERFVRRLSCGRIGFASSPRRLAKTS
jgi:integrase